jgi:hypothetical protein
MLKPKYSLSSKNEFIIENFASAPAFSSFFPGIAGLFGCPMWVFYANRGQCVASAGVQDKNGAIIEFQPANKAYRDVSLSGFRTFLKVDGEFYEPFSGLSPFPNKMIISPDSLTIVEENPKLKLKVEATYFTLPNENFPALARLVRLHNRGTKARKVEIIDGLPVIIPFGFDNDLLKKISQTIEAWCTVENLDGGAPFYKLKVLPADCAETKLISEGNFFVCNSGAEIIVDPSVVFGQASSLECPARFMRGRSFSIPKKQQTEGFIPSAFAYKKGRLKKGASLEISSLFGRADNLSQLKAIRKKIAEHGFLEKKRDENRELIKGICSAIKTESSCRPFDLYAAQTFLDNVLRGGLPVTVDKKVVYVYYRKHGDMERDYNDFQLMPAYFSQGNGNYRDINQNRRNDLYFNPDLAESNLSRFINLLQLDGYNPLIVPGSQYIVKSPGSAEELIKKHIKNPGRRLVDLISRPFLLGQLVKEVESAGGGFVFSSEKFTEELLTQSDVEEGAAYGEGFWIDHFSYNTDLLESFESIFPDRIQNLLFHDSSFSFFDSEHVVVERSRKYQMIDGKLRQHESVRTDPEKAQLIRSRPSAPNQARADNGRGKVYTTTLAAKLLCLIANKAATFDPEGIGIEMEADKPGWYDALNGLPGLFGSSLSETLELKRLCVFLNRHFSNSNEIILPVEIHAFIENLNKELDGFFDSPDCGKYWEVSNQAKESFRRITRLGISGEEANLSGKSAVEFLLRVIKKCDWGIKKCLHKYKNYYTYFIHETTDGAKFTQRPLPLFLEGFVHALRVEKDRGIYRRVKNSPLFDKKLKMYKVNAPLEREPLEIGRARIFPAGWLENESIWLHMEYKYLLELLKAGMHEEFFADFKNAAVPFMDPRVYGRSILENSSFIVSSAHPDKEKHGRGFVARLSGASAEFIDMWITMLTGKNIFFLDKSGKLCFRLAPILPPWLFKKGEISFTLFSSIEVVYRKTSGPASYKLIFDDGEEVNFQSPVVPEPYASFIRDRKVKKIICSLSA